MGTRELLKVLNQAFKMETLQRLCLMKIASNPSYKSFLPNSLAQHVSILEEELKSTFSGRVICHRLQMPGPCCKFDHHCMIVTWDSGVWRFVFPDISALQIGGDG